MEHAALHDAIAAESAAAARRVGIRPDAAPMGATLAADGATFRVWAPAATAVTVRGNFNDWADHALAPSGSGYWGCFIPGVREGDRYKFHVTGTGTRGWKRDPYARALSTECPFPDCDCIVTRTSGFPWHDQGFRPPAFSDLVIYQLHVGAFCATDAQGRDVRRERTGRFLDVLERVEYLAALGVTAVQLLPIQEFRTERSLGYNGTDYFSPEMDYCFAPEHEEFAHSVARANELLARRGLAPYRPQDLDTQPKQLMALVDILHAWGIAVIFDVVYNHAGGGFDDESLYFMDRQAAGDNNRSLFFTDRGWAGGLVFAYWKQEVRQFLIDNAAMLLAEFHADGFRFDEVTVIDRHGGWRFLQDLTDTLRFLKPQAPLIAEYWADASAALRPRAEGGAGFDAVLASDLRQSLRGALAQAAQGADARVDLCKVARALQPAHDAPWRAVQHLENHDIVRVNNTTDRQPRVAALADASDARSWYARSRSRVANGLLLTAPGIPMLFMGQEFLEDKYWSDSPGYFADSLIWWDGLAQDRAMQDHQRFVRELLALRRTLPALRRGGIRVHHVDEAGRVLAFHRWIEGEGQDVVVVLSLREQTWWSYELGFPAAGFWREAFNSDVYDGWVNPRVAGNGGRIEVGGPPMHGFATSAAIVIPANAMLVFARTS